MDEDRPWLGEEPTARADLTFPPVGTAIAVFLAVAAPLDLLGIARAGGTNVVIVAVGIVVVSVAVGMTVGTVVAVAAGLALAFRDGRGQNIRGRTSLLPFPPC